MCELLEIKIASGNTKISQLKELNRFCDYEKQGNKFIIKEIFEEPLPKQDDRTFGNNTKMFEELNIKENEYNNIGIYYILKDNDIYIGSTFSGYKGRFKSHYYNYNGDMQHTYDLLHDGATFNILYDTTGIEDEPLIRQLENDYIQYYINYTDYNVINKREKAWSFLENTDKIKYKNIKVAKDKYDQAIQLLIDNDLIEIIEDNNITIELKEVEFDTNNIPF